jgi:ATP-dependent DNA ligase
MLAQHGRKRIAEWKGGNGKPIGADIVAHAKRLRRNRHACALGLKGIVSKRVTSRYKSGSCVNWVKVKNPAYERRPGA